MHVGFFGCVCQIYALSYLPAVAGINYSLHTLRLSLCLYRRPPESYSCHSVTFPIHNWGAHAAQSPWNHVNHFQLLLLNNQAEPTVPWGICLCSCLYHCLVQSVLISAPLLSSPADPRHSSTSPDLHTDSTGPAAAHVQSKLAEGQHQAAVGGRVANGTSVVCLSHHQIVKRPDSSLTSSVLAVAAANTMYRKD